MLTTSTPSPKTTTALLAMLNTTNENPNQKWTTTITTLRTRTQYPPITTLCTQSQPWILTSIRIHVTLESHKQINQLRLFLVIAQMRTVAPNQTRQLKWI